MFIQWKYVTQWMPAISRQYFDSSQCEYYLPANVFTATNMKPYVVLFDIGANTYTWKVKEDNHQIKMQVQLSSRKNRECVVFDSTDVTKFELNSYAAIPFSFKQPSEMITVQNCTLKRFGAKQNIVTVIRNQRRKALRLNCPFHKDKNPSAMLYYNPNGSLRFRCFSTNCSKVFVPNYWEKIWKAISV